ncbi:MAG: polysaccharide deacetylase family protein [Verrucomicrobia bacterium]|nr:polysaccharide deacetylase family protein [Verrucomicrobiota bacterium]
MAFSSVPGTIWVRRASLAWLPADVVLLTFDDGPNELGRTTDRLLDVLERERVRAAFCLIGRLAEQAPAVVRRMRDSGHLLVNHTYQHRVEHQVRAVERELSRCDEAIGRACGMPGYLSRWFRPPGGWLTRAIRTCTAARGLQILPVTHFAFDTLYSHRGARQLVETHVRVAKRDRGGIFVVHDGLIRLRPLDRVGDFLGGKDRTWVPEAVEEMIRRLRTEGIRFGAPEEVLPGTGTKS